MPCLVPVRCLPTQGILVAYTRSDHVTRNEIAARNNEAYGQGNGKQSFAIIIDTGILLLAVFTLELEMD